ncbi:hypothetical protein F5883DRAFT_435924 [Diaporthe sp. PMI_573]|nr:hypothetical protein F5883DRAFT_435924 [Diaporthaceae sp. PMI_573]
MAASHPRSLSAAAALDNIPIDLVGSRLELVKGFGATRVVNPAQGTLGELVAEITKGDLLDAVLDCTGSLAVIDDMIKLTGRGGIAVSVGGPPPGAKLLVDVFDMLISCKTYRGCHQGKICSKTFIPWLAELYSKGLFPIEKMQKIYVVDDINFACQEMLSGIVLKPVLLWD